MSIMSKPREVNEMPAAVEGMSYLTVAEVASLLRLHGTSVRAMASDGRLPGAIRIGSVWRFRREQLIGWLTRETQHEEEQTD